MIWETSEGHLTFMVNSSSGKNLFIKKMVSSLVSEILSELNPSRPNSGRREKNLVKFLFSHFFLVPQKVL